MATAIEPPKQVTIVTADVDRTSSERNETEKIPPSGQASRDVPKAPERYSMKDLLLLLGIIFLPMLAISLILLAFTFFARFHITFNTNGTSELPVDHSSASKYSYYTTIGQSKVSLVSSWASHASQFVMPFFMVLFSFCVAREVSGNRPRQETIENTKEIHDLLHSLLKGVWKELWPWFKFTYQGKRAKTPDDLRALHLAALGIMISFLFGLCLMAGETWLHLTVSSPTLRYYEEITRTPNTSDNRSVSSYQLIDDCQNTMSSALLDPFAPSSILPCSLSQTSGLLSLSYPEAVYTMLDLGIYQLASSSGGQFWPDLTNLIQQYPYVGNQTVTYIDPNTSLTHALLFWQPGAVQFSSGAHLNRGIDFVASTTSMSTTCTPITQACGLFNATHSTSQNLSIPYNCSSLFFGDLNVPPIDGLDQFKGWDTSFYSISNGFPKNISVASQLNPFYYNVTAALTSTSFADIAGTGDPDVGDNTIVDAGNGRIAFALSCNSTVYDVQYALVNGSITYFSATPSDPRKASIIKAPLQVGFGRHELFSAANLAALDYYNSIPDDMAASFSLIGMALTSGVFQNATNIQQRERYDIVLTQVPKSTLWFLVALCLTYAAVGLGIAILALVLRQTERYASTQSALLPREKTDLKLLLFKTFKQVKGLVNWKDDAQVLYDRERRYL